MTPEFVEALRVRIAAGRTKEEMQTEAYAVGYTEAQFTEAYAAALRPKSLSVLPSYRTYIAEVWQLLWSQSPLILKTFLFCVVVFVSVGSLLFIVSDLASFSQEVSFLVMMVIVPIGSVVVSLVASLALMRALLQRNSETLYHDHLIFAAKNFIPLSLVTIYVAIVTQVGYSLLIIPGFMAAVYLLFVTPVFASGRARGFMALAESTALIYGRFWPVILRLVVVSGLIVLCLIGCFGIGALIFTSLVNSPVAALWLFPFIFVLLLAMALLVMSASAVAIVVLYEACLRIPSPDPLKTPLQKVALFYKVIVGLVVVILAIIAFAIGFIGTTILSNL